MTSSGVAMLKGRQQGARAAQAAAMSEAERVALMTFRRENPAARVTNTWRMPSQLDPGAAFLIVEYEEPGTHGLRIKSRWLGPS